MLCRRVFGLILVGVLAVTLFFPGSVAAQGRGQGRGLAKKDSKFINGHDAREGRWDGRGPRPRLRVWTYRNRGHHRGWLKRRHKRIRVRYVR
jgi:hypothetical protein